MYIWATKFLKDSASNAELDGDKRLYIESIGLDWDNFAEIKKTIAVDKNDKDKVENFGETNRQLKREKQYWSK